MKSKHLFKKSTESFVFFVCMCEFVNVICKAPKPKQCKTHRGRTSAAWKYLGFFAVESNFSSYRMIKKNMMLCDAFWGTKNTHFILIYIFRGEW